MCVCCFTNLDEMHSERNLVAPDLASKGLWAEFDLGMTRSVIALLASNGRSCKDAAGLGRVQSPPTNEILPIAREILGLFELERDFTIRSIA